MAEQRTHKYRVLVVDDEPALRDVQRRMLELDGHEVVVASGASQAREIVEREPVDLVITDLRMPGNFDGRALYAWLRAAYPRLAANALFVTGNASAENDDALPRERIIVKPFTREELVSRARAALSSASE